MLSVGQSLALKGLLAVADKHIKKEGPISLDTETVNEWAKEQNINLEVSIEGNSLQIKEKDHG